jgi:hypothetical protein
MGMVGQLSGQICRTPTSPILPTLTLRSIAHVCMVSAEPCKSMVERSVWWLRVNAVGAGESADF